MIAPSLHRCAGPPLVRTYGGALRSVGISPYAEVACCSVLQSGRDPSRNRYLYLYLDLDLYLCPDLHLHLQLYQCDGTTA